MFWCFTTATCTRVDILNIRVCRTLRSLAGLQGNNASWILQFFRFSMTCTWWIMLSVNWSSWKNVGLILHLHADYLLLHFWTDLFFFSAIKIFSQLKWVCISCLDHLDLAGLLIFNSWWRNPFLWIEVVGGILGTSDICRLMEKSLPVKGVSWWNFGNVVRLQIGNVIELQIFLLCPHSWIHMHRALFCSNNEKCYHGVLFKEMAGVCSLCLVRFVQMSVHSQCSLFWCSVVGSHFSSSQCSCRGGNFSKLQYACTFLQDSTNNDELKKCYISIFLSCLLCCTEKYF